MSGQFSQVLLGIVLGRTFGPVGKGIFSFAQLLVTIATAVGEGIRSAYAFERTRGGTATARELWGATLVLIASVSLPAGLFFVAMALRAPGQLAYPFVAIAFPAVVYLQAVNLLWAMYGRIETLNVRNTVTFGAGSSLAGAVAVSVFHAPLGFVLGLWSLGIVLGALWATIGVSAFLGGSPQRPSLRHLRVLAGFASKSTFSQLATFLARRVDVFIVLALASKREFGIYSLAVATAELMFQVSNSITWTTIGRVAVLDAPEATALVARIIRGLLITQVILAAVLFAVGPSLISLVYGHAFAEAGLPLRLMLPGIVCFSADQLLSFVIAARLGRPGLLLGFETLSLTICGTATYAGVLHAGIAGAAAANTLTYLVSFAVKTTYFARTSNLSASDVLIARWSDAPQRLRRLF